MVENIPRISNPFYPFCAYCPIKGTLANSIDPDQMPQNAPSDQSLQFSLSTEICMINDNSKNNQTHLPLDMALPKEKK